MARLLRQREDDKGKWDVLDDEGPSGARVDVVETPQAAELTKRGFVIASGDDWNAAAQRSAAQQDVARERAGVLAKAGAGAPGMVHALDDRGEPVVASLGTIRQRGWEAVTPETAAKAGEEYVRRQAAQEPNLDAIRQEMLRADPSKVPVSAAVPNEAMPSEPVPYEDMRAADGATLAVDENGGVVQTYATPEQIRARGWRVIPPGGAPKPFKPLSGDDVADTEQGVRNFLASMASGSRAAPSRPGRPAVSVQAAGGAGVPRAFAPLAGAAPVSALPPEVEGFLARAAGDSAPPPARLTDSATAIRPSGDEELRAAQERGELLDFLARAGVGFDDTARIIAGVGGSARPPPAGLRERPVEDLMQRRAAAQQEEAKARAASLRDPASAESERARAMVRAAAPDLFTPEELGNLTASDLESALDVSKLRAGLEERRAARTDANAQREADRTLREQMAKDAAAARGAARADAAAERALRQEEMGARRTAEAEQKQADKLSAEERKLQERNVGGFTFDSKNPPTMESAKKMAGITIARDQVLGSLDKLESLYDETGSEMFGDKAGEMESAWMDVTNRLRQLNEMGVPNGADYAMLAKQLQDPTSMQAMFRSTGRAKAQMRELRRQLGQTVDATAKALKFTPEGQQAARPAPAASPPRAPAAASPGKVRVTDGRETLEIDVDDLPDAKRDGFREVT